MVYGTRADFSQNDPRWSGHLLGFSTREYIGRFGCLVVAGANVAQAHGKDVDPLQMNQKLRDAALFVGPEKSDISTNDFVSRLYPDIKFVERKDWPQAEVAPGKYFNIRQDLLTDIIIKIDYHPNIPGVQDHYCRVIGTNQAYTDVEIIDSWDGKRKYLSAICAGSGKQPLQIIWAAIKYTRR